MIISELSYKNIFAGNCPKSHPFAYNNGNHCCQVNREKYYEPLGIACDGSTIDGNSKCCEDNRYTACTDRPCGDYEEGKFKEIWNETVADKLLGTYYRAPADRTVLEIRHARELGFKITPKRSVF